MGIVRKGGRKIHTAETLWALVDRKAPDACWEWKGWRNAQGYGRVQVLGKSYYAHRVMYELAHRGQLDWSAPANHKAHGFVMHTCDNPPCCNPSHLCIATQKDNMQDRLLKGGYGSQPKGERHPASVMSDMQRNELKRLHYECGVSQRKAAERLGVSVSAARSYLYEQRKDKTPREVFSPEQIEQILALSRQGLTQQRIADMYGKTRSTIASIIRRKG